MMGQQQQRVSSVPSCSQAPLGQSCCCCKRCNMGGCDLSLDCGCCFHTRCFPSAEQKTWTVCPLCRAPVQSIKLLPMNFDEIDQAQAQAQSMAVSNKRGKKRRNATISRLNPSQTVEEGSDLRTGRWTTEETAYCDKLIELFERGMLPIPDGHKLNDFLSSMLKSKQSRLTKKMKNAKLSARQYKRMIGYIDKDDEAREFSILETEFFASIRCNMERLEIRFHMQKEWREFFSNFCLNIGQNLDPNDWLHSVEELDRRTAVQKDAARMERRKVMMGYAFHQDASNQPNGVIIDPKLSVSSTTVPVVPASPYGNDSDSDANNRKKRIKLAPGKVARSPRLYSSPFIGKVLEHIQRHGVPFEHVDAWVPSFVSLPGDESDEQKCRLCFAGCGTTETQIPTIGSAPVRLSSQEQFDYFSFGEYSQKFSFEVGSGLPGRVYSSGVASWEQGIQNAPSGLFERKGGAVQWGVHTVLGVPIPSPSVGRIVILFYSRFDRPKDQEIVNRISDELTKLMPSPKWKLVVEIGASLPCSDTANSIESQRDVQLQSLLTVVETYMPVNKSSPLAAFLPGFTSLRILLSKQSRTEVEEKRVDKVLESFEAHKRVPGRGDAHVAAMVARDFMIATRPSLAYNDHSNSKAADASVAYRPSVGSDSLSGPSQQPSFGSASLSGLLSQQQQPSRMPAAPPLNWVSAAMQQQNVAQSPLHMDLALASPSLQALVAGQTDLIPLNMTTGQIAALLQNDAINFPGAA